MALIHRCSKRFTSDYMVWQMRVLDSPLERLTCYHQETPSEVQTDHNTRITTQLFSTSAWVLLSLPIEGRETGPTV